MYRPPGQRKRPDWAAAAGDSRKANDDATALVAYLIAGPLTYGFLGHLADRWLGTSFGVALGTLAGMALSLYLVWLRYGRK